MNNFFQFRRRNPAVPTTPPVDLAVESTKSPELANSAEAAASEQSTAAIEYPPRPQGFLGVRRVAAINGLTFQAVKKLLATDGYLADNEPTEKALAEGVAVRARRPDNFLYQEGRSYTIVWDYKFMLGLLARHNALGNAGYGIYSVKSAVRQLNRAAEELLQDPALPQTLRPAITAIMQADHQPILLSRENTATRRAAIAYVEQLTNPITEQLDAIAHGSPQTVSAKRRISNIIAWLKPPHTEVANRKAEAKRAALRDAMPASPGLTPVAFTDRPTNRSDEKGAVDPAAFALPPLDEARWIEAHGSRRLKACLAENIPYDEIFAAEFASHGPAAFLADHPGWLIYNETLSAKYRLEPPRNPPEEAFDLLDKARLQIKDAKLIAVHKTDGEKVVSGWSAIAERRFGENPPVVTFLYAKWTHKDCGA